MICDFDLFINNGLMLLEHESPFNDLVVFLDLLGQLLDLVLRQVVGSDDCDDRTDAGPDQ